MNCRRLDIVPWTISNFLKVDNIVGIDSFSVHLIELCSGPRTPGDRVNVNIVAVL